MRRAESECHLVMVFGSDAAAAQTSDLTLGAKLGANARGLLRTAMDSEGNKALRCKAVWTAVDAHGHRLEI